MKIATVLINNRISFVIFLFFLTLLLLLFLSQKEQPLVEWRSIRVGVEFPLKSPIVMKAFRKPGPSQAS